MSNNKLKDKTFFLSANDTEIDENFDSAIQTLVTMLLFEQGTLVCSYNDRLFTLLNRIGKTFLNKVKPFKKIVLHVLIGKTEQIDTEKFNSEIFDIYINRLPVNRPKTSVFVQSYNTMINRMLDKREFSAGFFIGGINLNAKELIAFYQKFSGLSIYLFNDVNGEFKNCTSDPSITTGIQKTNTLRIISTTQLKKEFEAFYSKNSNKD